MRTRLVARLPLAISLCVLPAACDASKVATTDLPVAVLLLCDGTGIPERSCTADWIEPLERQRELVVITSAADYGSTVAWPTHRHDGVVRGHRRLFAEQLVDNARDGVAQVAIPIDPPPGQVQTNQSHLLAALTLVSRIAGEYKRRGFAVELHVASDGRFIGGDWNAEKTVPSGVELWQALGDVGEQFDLSPVTSGSWCGLHNLSTGTGDRTWTYAKDQKLERLLVGILELAGGPALDTRRDCTVPATSGVES